MTICQQCGGPLPPPPPTGGPARRYCSPTCRERTKVATRCERRRRVCTCGATICDGAVGTRCRDCYLAAVKRKQQLRLPFSRGPLPKAGCRRGSGGRILTDQKRSRCRCGRPMTCAARRCRACGTRPAPAPRACAFCGEVFQPNHHGGRFHPKCAQAYVIAIARSKRLPDTVARERLRERRRRGSEKRRAAGFRPMKGRWRIICDRDGWVCWLCGRDIDPTIAPPQSWSGSMDHVVPLTRGGTDDDDNLRAAHLRCNIRRRNRDVPPGAFNSLSPVDYGGRRNDESRNGLNP